MLFILRRVHGISMIPVLPPGTLVWGTRWFRGLRPGQVVILRYKGRELIKRVQRVERNSVFVVGDHSEASLDSRQFGAVPLQDVVARVVWPRAPQLG